MVAYARMAKRKFMITPAEITSARAQSGFLAYGRSGWLSATRPLALQRLRRLIVLHPRHLHVPAQRDGREDELRLAPVKAPQALPEAQREARHLDPHRLVGAEMTELV